MSDDGCCKKGLKKKKGSSRFLRRSAEIFLALFFFLWMVQPIAFSKEGNGGPGRLSPASLDLDTADCPSTFDPPICEKQTEWTLEKTTSTGPLINPNNEPFSYTVTVTEGGTKKILSGSGQIVVTNSGDLSAVLSSIVVNLEDLTPRTGDAPGPSGLNWTVLGTAIATESSDCEALGEARTCFGTLVQTAGANLVLFDSDSNDVIALSDVLPIPATIDNDGDGLRDEDPPDGIDNDGDGLIDEDGACEDAVIINFEYEFDISDLGIEGPGDGIVPSADDLRINLIATFGSAGKRGGSGASCTEDANCNGTIDVDDTGTPLVNESEKNNIRSVQQRLRFDPIACDPVCQTVTLTDDGAVSDNPSCVTVDSTTTIDEDIDATEVEGTTTVRTVSGTVTCIGEDCNTVVTNMAMLICDDNSLITGSPATASFDVSCEAVEPPPIEVGDFCTQTQGGWGQACNKTNPCGGGNVGCFRDCNFAALFPSGLIVGDPDGPDADSSFAILLTDSMAVEDYLPAGATPAALTADQTDPLTTSSGVFGGQLVAATLNVAVDDAGLRRDGGTQPFPQGTLGTLIYVNCVNTNLLGLSVNDVLALANTAISGGGTPTGVTISDLSDALAVLNENFVDCDTNIGCLALP